MVVLSLCCLPSSGWRPLFHYIHAPYDAPGSVYFYRALSAFSMMDDGASLYLVGDMMEDSDEGRRRMNIEKYNHQKRQLTAKYVDVESTVIYTLFGRAVSQ